MEIQKITYENKEYIRNDPQYPETETVTDGNMNEIKKVVNNNADKQDEDYLKLKNALINAETEEAKSLHVTDANKFGQLEVFGNQEQETRSGKNRFKLPDSGNNNGITYTNNGDGTFNISGTATEQASFSIVIPLANSGFEQGKNYTISSNVEIGNIKYYVHSCTASGAWNKTLLDFINETSKTKEMPAPSTDYISLNMVVFKDVTVNYQNVTVQIEEGTVATEYEQYGASPSPDYPSKVVCLGSNVKNIFTETNVLSDVYLNRSHEIVENQDYVMYYFEVEPNQNYVLSFKYTQNLVELGKIGYGFSDSVPFIGQELEAEDTYSIFGNKVNGKVIIPSKKYLIFNFIKSMYNTMYDIQLEKGTEATSYSPYRTR